MGALSGLGCVKCIERTHIDVFKLLCALLDGRRQRNGVTGEVETALDPYATELVGIARSFEIVDRGTNHGHLIEFDEIEDHAQGMSFEPNAGLSLIIEGAAQGADVRVDEHGSYGLIRDHVLRHGLFR